MTCAQSLAGAPEAASSTESPPKPDIYTGRRRARLALLPALALLLGALGQFAAVPAAAQVTAPSVPQNVQANPAAGAVTITWQAPDSWGTWPARAYILQMKQSAATGNAWGGVTTTDRSVVSGIAATSLTSVTMGDKQRSELGYTYTVDNGSNYDVRIRAASQQPMTDGTDPSHFRYSSWVTVRGVTAGAPAAIARVNVAAGPGKLDATWPAPASTVSPITGYDVHYTASSTVADNAAAGSAVASEWVAVSRSGTTASQTIAGLAADTAYRVRVRARNTHGAAPWAFGTGTLVSTLGQSPHHNLFSTDGFVIAQGFTTGSEAYGYELAGIEVYAVGSLNAAQSATLRAELWSAATGGGPDSRLASLFHPPSVRGGSNVSFRAPSGTRLAASTTYYFVVYTTDATEFQFGGTSSNAEDSDGQAGWSVADTHWYMGRQQPSGNWTEETTTGNDQTLLMRVSGEVAATPPTAPTVSLVKNYSQTQAAGTIGANGYVNAQSFTTGARDDGYRLDGIGLIATFSTAPTTAQLGELKGELWSAATGGAPNAKLAELTPPSSLTSGSEALFEAPEGTWLLPSTSYFFLVYTTSTYDLRMTTTASGSEDSGGATGWTITNDRHYWDTQQPGGTGGTGTWQTLTGSVLRINVKGSAEQIVVGPGRPGNVRATPGDGQVTLNWEAPESWGSWPAGGYGLEFQNRTDNPSWATVHSTRFDATDPAATSYVHRGLVGGFSTDNGDLVGLRINSWSSIRGPDAQQGDPFKESATVTVWTTVGAPEQISDLRATAGGGKALILTWTAPASTVSPITGYDVHYTSAGGSTVTDEAEASGDDPAAAWVAIGHSGTAASNVIRGLTRNTQYRVRVRARNTHGGAPWAFGTGTTLSTLSNNANLSALIASSASSASGPYSSLNIGTFAAATTEYTATVAHTVTHLKLGPTAAHWGATVAVAGTAVESGRESGAIALSVGSNAITVRVTAENSTTKDYTVTITRRGSPNADLSGLAISRAESAGGTYIGLTLVPETFAPATTAYTATVHNNYTHFKITPTAAHAAASITVNGTTVGSGSASNAISLSVGSNAITVQVTAQDGTTKDYTVTVTRAPKIELTGLSMAVGANAVALNPSFARNTLGYTATVATGTTSVTVTPTWTATGTSVFAFSSTPNWDARITNDVAIASSGGSAAVNLASSGDTWVGVRIEHATHTATYRITVGEGGTVTISATPNPVDEGSATTVRVTLSEAATSAVTIPLTITDGTADAGDRGTLASLTVAATHTFSEGTITTSHDADADDETFTVALGNLPAGLSPGSPSSVEVTITDDEKPTVSLSASPRSVAEGSPVTVTATLTAALSADVTVPVTVTRGTSDAGDHGTLASITVAAGQTAGQGTVTTNHDADEDNETFTVALGGTLPAAVTAGSPSSVEITIVDDEGLPRVSLSAAPNPVTEGSATTVTATLSRALASRVAIPVTLTPGTAGTADYGALASIPIDGGATSGTGAVRTTQDTVVEGEETFTVALGTLPADVRAGTPSSVEVRIADDDTATLTLSVSPTTVAEGESVTVAARLSRTLADPLTVPLTVTRGSSESGDHGTAPGIEIAAGARSAAGGIATTDDADEDDETFTVALDAASLPATVTAGTTTPVEVTIVDADTTATLAVAPNPVTEGESVTVTVSLTRARERSLTIPVTVTRETSEEEDHGTLSEIRIGAGATSGAATIATRHDDGSEDEAFAVALDAANLPANVRAGTPSSARVAIDDDDTPTVGLHARPNPVTEGDDVTITARLSAALPGMVRIPVTTTRETSESGDHGSLSSILVPAGRTSGTGTIWTARDGDTGNERFKVALDVDNLPDELGAGSRRWVRVTITEAGTLATAWLSAAPNPVDEGAAVTVTAHLDHALNAAVTIPLDVFSADPAAHGALESIEIAANATSGAGTLQTHHDDDALDEYITIVLGEDLPTDPPVRQGRESEGHPSSVRVTVTDDDPHPAGAAASVWLLPSASDPGTAGTVRIANRSGAPGGATLTATDDAGGTYPPLELRLGALSAAEFDAADLERGSPAKGIAGGTGPGTGAWRLGIDSALDVEATAYARAADGFAAPLDAVVPARDDGTLEVALFEPAGAFEPRSLLRLVNPNAEDANVVVTGTDDLGRPGLAPVRLTIPAGAACTVDAAQLESGAGLACGGPQTGLGDGAGRWRLAVRPDVPLVGLNLLAGADGRLSNLSAAGLPEIGGAVRVPLFPAAGDPSGRQGVVRIVNRSREAGTVRIDAADDGTASYAPLALAIGPGQAVDLDADDLELGNRAKGLTGGTGAGSGTWRLALSGDTAFTAHAYVRTPEGFLTATRPVRLAASNADGARARPLALLDAGRGVLRLANPGPAPATATVLGVDDAGERPGGPVRIAVPARSAVELTAADLESGAADAIVSGALGDGSGGWRLTLGADAELAAMSLLAGPGGHLAELSSGGGAKAVEAGRAPTEEPFEPRDGAAER